MSVVRVSGLARSFVISMSALAEMSVRSRRSNRSAPRPRCIGRGKASVPAQSPARTASEMDFSPPSCCNHRSAKRSAPQRTMGAESFKAPTTSPGSSSLIPARAASVCRRVTGDVERFANVRIFEAPEVSCRS